MELFISPLICTLLSVFLSKAIIYTWPIFFSNYHPSSRASLLSLIFSSISIYISSRLLVYFHNNPTRNTYFVSIPVNFSIFGVAFAFLVFSRHEYHRPDMLVYFMVSCIVLFVTSLVYENKREFVFIEFPYGQPVKLINSQKVRIISKNIKNIRSIKQKNINLIDGIIIDFNHEIPSSLESLIGESVNKGLRIYSKNEIIERFDGYIPHDGLATISMRWRAGYEIYELVKRLLDIIMCCVLMPIFIPIILISCVSILLDSPGSAIFKQKRVGKCGKVFYIYKLRTMYLGNENLKIINATTNDYRVTRVGRFLRRSRLDEFPQIINILLGDMSWIGPRPETVELSEIYAKEIPLYLYRLRLRPGLSGWAAVNQGYVTGQRDTYNKLNYDLFYLKNCSFELDLIIMFRTIYIILSGYGAL